MNKNSIEQSWYPIGDLPWFSQMLEEEIENVEELFTSFSEALPKPHILDDETIDRAIRFFNVKLELLGYPEQQADRWRQEATSSEEQKAVEAYVLNYKKQNHCRRFFE